MICVINQNLSWQKTVKVDRKIFISIEDSSLFSLLRDFSCWHHNKDRWVNTYHPMFFPHYYKFIWSWRFHLSNKILLSELEIFFSQTYVRHFWLLFSSGSLDHWGQEASRRLAIQGRAGVCELFSEVQEGAGSGAEGSKPPSAWWGKGELPAECLLELCSGPPVTTVE